MMLKVNNEYLEFNADVELERQVKLFEELSKTAGDFSYEFEIELTSTNIRILQCPFPDNIQKNVYHKVGADLLGDDGISIHKGYLQIGRIKGRIAYTSFFSGNNNWFGLLSGPLSDIYFDDLTVDQTQIEIISSWTNTDGIIFPLVDNNTLLQRRSPELKIEDFIPFIYAHTVVKRIFQAHSIKLEGELFSDVNYKRLAITKSPSDQIESRSAYVGKDSIQHVGLPPDQLTFDDDSNSPFFDGSHDNFNLSTSEYVADVRMRLKVDVSVTFDIPQALVAHKVYIYVNGVEVKSGGFIGLGVDQTFTLSDELVISAGDSVTVYASAGAGGCDVSLATNRFTPTYLYVAFGTSPIPDWTQQEFVSNVFRLFNTISDYDPVRKILTVNLFENIKTKPAIDFSEYISEVETDYTDFVSNYAKKSLATYQSIKFDDWAVNGIVNIFTSGDGQIEIDNDFLEDSGEMLESDFTNSQSYIHPIFDMSIERLNTLDLESIENTNATTVSDSSGVARFNGIEDIFVADDLVRISDSPVSSYNGDWIVETVGSGWVEFRNLLYASDSTAQLDLMKHVYTGDEDVYAMFVIPQYSISKFSSLDRFLLEANFRTRMAVGYFNMLDTGRQINEDFTQSLSFGITDSQFAYQRTMLDTYWSVAGRVLNDPVKELATVNLPHKVYTSFNFLSPVTIKTLDSSNLYYLNRITGYKGKEFDSISELIKLP